MRSRGQTRTVPRYDLRAGRHPPVDTAWRPAARTAVGARFEDTLLEFS